MVWPIQPTTQFQLFPIILLFFVTFHNIFVNKKITVFNFSHSLFIRLLEENRRKIVDRISVVSTVLHRNQSKEQDREESEMKPLEN